MSANGEAACDHRSPGPGLTAFALISLLSHLLVLIALSEIAAVPRPSEGLPDRNPLSVRIYTATPGPTPADHRPPSAQPPDASSAKTETDRRSDEATTLAPDIRGRPQQIPKRPHAATRDTRRHDITAIELMQQMLSAAPDIAEEREKKKSLVGPTEVFDPKFRNRLEQSRREQTRRRELERRLAKRPRVELSGDYGDYVGVRIGDKCWRVPVSDGSGPFDTRIWMWNSRCKRETVHFEWDRQPVR